MSPIQTHRGWTTILLGVALACRAIGQEADEDDRKARLALMESTIASLEVKSNAIKSQPALAFVAKPLLRYSDPTRGINQNNVLLDAGVWRLGEAGRPTALVTLEIYRADADTGVLSYEFASLDERTFGLQHAKNEKVAWAATGSALAMQALADAPPPAKNATGRLTQMRSLARKFAVRELVDGELIECRLLAQPIDRYSSEEVADGAIFVFANGTNPELGLFLEVGEKDWSYGAIRLSAAEVKLTLGEREVAHFPKGDYLGTRGTYASNHHTIELPKPGAVDR
jgi:hypothetical protein